MKKFTFLKLLSSLIATLVFSINANSQVPFGCTSQFYVSHSSGTASYSNGTLLDSLFFTADSLSETTLSASGSMGFNAIGIDPVDGYMYGVRYQSGAPSSQSHLVKIAISGTTAIETDLGAIQVGAGYITGGDAFAGCFNSNGTYYFVDGTKLYSITQSNLATATAHLVGNTGQSFIDIAIDPVTGQMYGATSSGLYTIDKNFGTATLVANFPNSSNIMAGLFFTADGSLYGYRGDGTFWLINKTTAALTAVGTGPSYQNADGASCGFNIIHNIAPLTFCPFALTPFPTDTLTISTFNSTGALQSGLTYSLSISDSAHRFRFIETPAQIAQQLFNSGFLPNNNASNVTLSVIGGATGTNYDSITISNFQVPTGADTFYLQIQVYTLGGTYSTVNIQSMISGLTVGLGSTNLSSDGISPFGSSTALSFCASAILPVNLLSFTGNYQNNTSLLNWEVENQLNFTSFEIQRSSNGFDFTTLGMEPAQYGTGALQYQYTDDLSQVNGNIFFYRLKMPDINGNYSYSNVIMIRKDQININGFSFIPNPVTNNSATIRFTSSSSGSTDIRVIDMTGKIVLRQQTYVYAGTNSISINNLSHLQPGTYTLQLLNDNIITNNKFSVIK